MSALEESYVMARRAELLKPRSWAAADTRLFSISPSVSLSPNPVFYPYFMVPYSVCLPVYRTSVPLHNPAPVILFLFFSFSSPLCFL